MVFLVLKPKRLDATCCKVLVVNGIGDFLSLVFFSTSSILNETIVANGSTFSFCNTVGQATSDKGYQEADIFDNEGKFELAKKYNLQMRAHTLLWHQQTAGRFFRGGYDDSKGLVSKDVMDARLEFYVKSVMKHVMEKEKALTGAAGTLVYCWDVTNEYIHRENGPQFPSWMDIYGNMGLEPTYVKKAYQCAYQMLEQYGVQDKVTLFYNDYNEYTDPMTD